MISRSKLWPQTSQESWAQQPAPKGTDYFVVFVDQLTRWPIIVPVKSLTTDELIRSLNQYVFPNHGMMDTLVSDQGSAYTSNEFKQFAADRDIHINFVAKGNHKANGLAERVVGLIHKAVTKLAKGKYKHWHELLPIIEFNLRTTPHSTTGITPAMALYGRDLKTGLLEIKLEEETALDERPYDEK